MFSHPILFAIAASLPLITAQPINERDDTSSNGLSLRNVFTCPKPVTETVTCTVTATPTEAATVTVTVPGTCVPTTTSTLPPLVCEVDAYFVQDRSLLQVNLKTGDKKVLSTTVGGTGAAVNAIGYNVLDNFIYGLQGTNVVRVGKDGSLEVVGKVDISAFIGDIDNNGQFYYSTGGKEWGQMDLKPGSSTYGKVVGKGTSDVSALPTGVSPADWAYSPAFPGWLYSAGLDAKGTVYVLRWSIQNQKWEVAVRGVPNFGLEGSGFGAVVATSDGVLYASHNGSGQILRIPLSNPNDSSKSPLGPKASTNDGCRCASRPDVAS